MFTKRQLAAIYVAGALTTVFAGTVTYIEMKAQPGQRDQRSGDASQLDRYKQIPPFSLTDQDGRTFTLDDLKGKVWLADFIFTTCPDQCPLISAHMAALQKKLPPDVHIVSISTDPQTDTPAVLKSYARRFGASPRWTFLTGPKDAVYDFIKNGCLQAVSSALGAQVVHSTRFMLVDKTGMARAYYDGINSASDPAILDGVHRLLNE